MAACWLLTLAVSLLPAALSTNGGEACDCNGMSRQCVFDWQLLMETGNGYRCLGCMGNTAGVHCERCKDGYYRQWDGDCCLPCHCHPHGSLSTQCDGNGRCSCKPGVMGEKCDRCQPGFHSLSEAGCQRYGQSQLCACDPAGTADCISGRCICKVGVTGERCDRCKQNFYNLDARNLAGCSPCFCYGHSSSCVSAENYSVHKITSTFQQGPEGWTGVHEDGSPAELEWSPRHQDVFIAARRWEALYFVAPAKFLGNQQLSYGQTLSFDYRLDRGGRLPSPHDVILEGGGLRVTAPFLPSGKVLPCGVSETYTFRLDEHPSSKWSPRLNYFEYRRLLGNLTALWIRATFGEYSTGYIDNITLVSAQPTAGVLAPWVEQCQCPDGYQGQFCERCAAGYRRDAPHMGPFSICVPCNCHGGGICDPDTGECYSGDENVGNIISCPFGSYRDPRPPHSCRACPCGHGQSCSVLPGREEVVCDHCPPGAAGPSCEFCADGYFGDPAASQPCQLCQCNGNVEPNAVGNCDRRTGECLKCIYNTAGFHCERCKDGFFGNPLAPNPADKCRACSCNSVGAEPLKCRNDGSCICKPGFGGPNCEQSECPACYSQVKAQVDLYLQQLQEMELLSSEVKNGGGAVGQELERKMQLAEETLQAILREALSLFAVSAVLRSTCQSRLDDAKAAVERLMSLGRQYERQAQDVRRLLETARLDLSRSGASLSRAVRQCVCMHHATNPELRESMEKARTSCESFVPVGSGHHLSFTVPSLLPIPQLSPPQFWTGTGGYPIPHFPVSSRVTLGLQSSVPIFVFQGEASQLKQDAAGLLSTVDMYMAQYRQLQSHMGRWEEEIKKLLQRGEGERAMLTQLLSRANLARSTALQAVSAGNATFYEVEQILKSLRGFNLQADDKRREAEDAMRRLQVISSMVTSAKEKTDRAEAILGNAAAESKAASSTAGEAKEITFGIQKEITRLRLEANKTADGVLMLEKAVAALQHEAKEVDGEFQSKVSEAEADAAMIQETTKEAQDVHTKAGQTGVMVQETLGVLEELLRLMNQPGAVDEEGLKQLELNFSKAKTKTNQLKEQMSELEQRAMLQKGRVQKLDSSIDEILADIRNLEDIQRSLPPGCYNTKAIELP
uniref:Laminin subunit gamma 2 n=1 Tax=Coturnix japonica TaxID=93934 RepID=A0A8C2UE08_COTJA